jgi:transposase
LGRIEAEAALILSQVAATPDITLCELAEKLRRERQLSVGIGTLWRFFDRRNVPFKRRQRMPPSRR